jgi:branched-subunit amino acid aminotransferase/4-amino-4-deoxychorismate lyase
VGRQGRHGHQEVVESDDLKQTLGLEVEERDARQERHLVHEEAFLVANLAEVVLTERDALKASD